MASGFWPGEIIPAAQKCRIEMHPAGRIVSDGDEAMLYNDCAGPIRHGMHVFRAIVCHHVSIL